MIKYSVKTLLANNYQLRGGTSSAKREINPSNRKSIPTVPQKTDCGTKAGRAERYEVGFTKRAIYCGWADILFYAD